MIPPAGWLNPITTQSGLSQVGVDPLRLLPSRLDLTQRRLDLQRALRATGQPRFSPILVTTDGVIYDGHHAVRVAAEDGITVDVKVVADSVPASAACILDLPVH
jgi:precorrin isomerase